MEWSEELHQRLDEFTARLDRLMAGMQAEAESTSVEEGSDMNAVAAAGG